MDISHHSLTEKEPLFFGNPCNLVRSKVKGLPVSYSKIFRALLKSEEPLVLPGAFNPLVALAAKQAGFKGLYLSGGALSASLGKPDIGLTTMKDLTEHTRAIVEAAKLPLLVDADTGFGEAVNVHETVRAVEGAKAAGLHLEDQVLPKRCGHLEGKELIATEKMCEKIRAAVSAKQNKNFFIMARTDARSVEGLEGAIKRAGAYAEAGADGIFPEGLTGKEEFSVFAKAFPDTPLLANMTEFGKTPFISTTDFFKLGYRIVIFPVTTLRLAMKAVAEGLKALKKTGTQKNLIRKMQTRKELYELLDYDAYIKLDRRVTYK